MAEKCRNLQTEASAAHEKLRDERNALSELKGQLMTVMTERDQLEASYQEVCGCPVLPSPHRCCAVL